MIGLWIARALGWLSRVTSRGSDLAYRAHYRRENRKAYRAAVRREREEIRRRDIAVEDLIAETKPRRTNVTTHREDR